MSEDNDAPRKKGRDPILMIGTIILALAFVVVISGYAYGQFVPAQEDPAKFGDKVKVDYVGSFYGFAIDKDGNDNGNASVFDTSSWSVAKHYEEDDSPYGFSWSFTQRAEDKYTPFNVTIGSGGALKDFENAIIGMRPGETKWIEINAKDGYGVVPTANYKTWESADPRFVIDLTEKMTQNEFKDTFSIDTISPAGYINLSHPYGWKCNATVANDGFVYVTHLVDFDKDADDPYEAVAGGMKIAVSKDGASKFAVSFKFDKKADPSGGIQLIQFKFGGTTYYITQLNNDGSFKTKDTDEIIGMKLYFKITLLGYQ
ncbi:MAG: FKBP-type peptidyl-prolyl cis-trans isomerase [Methanomassiliicoccaceae archaeon]|nr:FKBP-type peptidyl-prolyl cis-trans isomerase [Methanomassiliicoccaceae archaeon]